MVKPKKMPVFWKIYIAIAVIFAIATAGWLFWLYGWLGDFEAAQPKYVAEATYERYFESFDAKEYVRLCSIGEDSIESTENVIAYLNSVTKGKEISYKKVATGLEDSTKYVVFATEGDTQTKFASFALTEQKNGAFKKYEAGEFEVYIDSKNTVNIEAPKGYSVLVNGKALSDKYIVENDIETDSCKHMPEGVSGIYYTKYSFKSITAEPEIKVVAADGTAAAVEKADGVYKASVIYNEALANEYSEWVLEAAELYARYTQYDENINVVTFKTVSAYFDPDSEVYESIRTLDNDFVQYYDSFKFTDKSAGEFIKYDDNTFSCRVQLTQLMYSKNDEYDDFIDQTLYLRRVGEEFLIYDMQVNVD